MNKSNLKSYAPQARKDFIAAVTARAHQLGFTSTHVQDATSRGDVLIIDGVEWPAKVAGQRAKLLDKILQHGFEQTMEEVAYTWFNRFAALRYMELQRQDFLEHGHRVLSSRDGGLPELLRHAADVSLPGLQAAKVQELQLAGNRDDELYKLLLVAQCNELSRVMPFLFERIDDETELLLPDNLLRTDSIVAKLVAGVPEEDWQEIEVIGWLYQFYISEKKDQVIGKVVKSEDIPAATQLFTPNWIVQYLVQNSVGRLWLMANPQSTLGKEWPYYITPAEQTPEVQAQLDALIQTRVLEDGDTLNPESITVLDPACGSGHILVVAYDVLKAIYLERGYRVRDIPRLILEKNLYGLDIDDRAAQMAGFALLMKARADDRRLFTATDDAGNLQPPKLNVLSLQESKGLNVDELANHLAPYKVQRATIAALVDTFEHAKTFGSLIQIPYALKTHLAVLPEVLAKVLQSGDMYASAAADDLLELVKQAQVLAMLFDAVVANPPYMGNKYLTPALRGHLKQNYDGFEKDLFSAFIVRDCHFAKPIGQLGFMSPFVWMFISSYENLRNLLINEKTITSLVQLEYSGFDGATVPICAFTFSNNSQIDFLAGYIRLSDFRGAENQSPKTLEAIADSDCGWFYKASSSRLKKIPGNPIAYWLSDNFLSLYKNQMMGNVFDVKEGVGTRNDDVFMKMCWEVSATSIGRDKRWILTDKAGDFKKWYMGPDFLMDWEDDGRRIKNYRNPDGSLRSRPQNLNYLFKEAISWGLIGSGVTSFRWRPAGYGFVSAAPSLFGESVFDALAQMNSKVVRELLKVRGATLNMTSGVVSEIPFFKIDSEKLHQTRSNSEKLVSIAKEDWNSKETAWDFLEFPFLNKKASCNRLRDSFDELQKKSDYLINLSKVLEEQNNQIYIDVYGLGSEVTATVPLKEITLTCNPAYRYGGDKSNDEINEMVRYDTMRELVSYIIGCMMGRYSLDEPGLIYAHAGNVGFDPSRYTRFAADADGILPITDEHWFDDDAPARVRDFLQVVWGPDTLAENMAWLAESLGKKSAKEASETPEETIRRYMADKFYKDHLQTYKKRPIYWLFSSGKQGAFQALVYLHRYNEGTLSRMRAEYVIPLTTKLATRLEMLELDANAATSASSASARTKIRKQIEGLRKKQVELLSFDEKLRHHADMRITLDLDDGVKVNYGKFGDLLDSVKVVTGGGSDD